MTTFLIFLPVRNGAAHIQSTIDSVLAQSFGDWQLVVLENGSTDATCEIVRAVQDPRVRLLSAPQDLGITGNWARVLQVLEDGTVSGELATLIGHDDILYPGFLEEMAALHRQHPKAGLYQAAFDLIDAQGGLIRPCRPIPQSETAEDFLAARAWGLRDSFGTGYVFRTGDFRRIGGMPALPRLIFADDLLVARLARTGGKACTTQALCAYRLHGGSMSGGHDASQLANHLEALARFLDILDDEFDAYMHSERGSAAVACLLARQVRLFWSPPLSWLVPAAGDGSLERLRQRFASMDARWRALPWTASGRLQARLTDSLRMAYWAAVLLRSARPAARRP